MNSSIQFAIARSDKELEQIFALKHRIFVLEKNRTLQSPAAAQGLLVSKWDGHAVHAFAHMQGCVLATVRIVYSPGNIGFRVSPILPNDELLAYFDFPIEASGGCVRRQYRNALVFTSLLYFRYCIAREIGADGIISVVAMKAERRCLDLGMFVIKRKVQYYGLTRIIFGTRLDSEIGNSLYRNNMKKILGDVVVTQIEKTAFEEARQGFSKFNVDKWLVELE